jgi:hypothetical protein
METQVEQAEQFDADDLTLMDVGETCRFFGGANSPLNPATLYRGIKSGKYPPPVKIGQATSRWVRGECERALRKMIAERVSAVKADGIDRVRERSAHLLSTIVGTNVAGSGGGGQRSRPPRAMRGPR